MTSMISQIQLWNWTVFKKNERMKKVTCDERTSWSCHRSWSNTSRLLGLTNVSDLNFELRCCTKVIYLPSEPQMIHRMRYHRRFSLCFHRCVQQSLQLSWLLSTMSVLIMTTTTYSLALRPTIEQWCYEVFDLIKQELILSWFFFF